MSVGAQFAEFAIFCGVAIERVAVQLAVVEEFSNWSHFVDAYFQLFICLITDVQVGIANNDERRSSLSKKLFNHDSTCSDCGGNAEAAASWT